MERMVNQNLHQELVTDFKVRVLVLGGADGAGGLHS